MEARYLIILEDAMQHKPCVRIIELADQLGVSAKEILSFIEESGIKAQYQTGYLSVELADAEKIRNEFEFQVVVLEDDIQYAQEEKDPILVVAEPIEEKQNRKLLGAIIQEKGLVSSEDIQKALGIQQRRGGPIGQILIDLGLIMEEELMLALSEQSGLELLQGIADIDIPRTAIRMLPDRIVYLYHVIPVRLEKDGLLVATDQPNNTEILEDIEKLTNIKIYGGVASAADIESAIHKYYPEKKNRVKTNKSLSLRTRQIKDSISNSNYLAKAWFDTAPTLGYRAFLAMPFSQDFEPVFESIISVCSVIGIRLLRVDQIPNLRNIWKSIEREIERADMLIADFTGDKYPDAPNPNVVTEAAIAMHKYEMPVIAITQTRESLFFDWRHQFTIKYNVADDGLKYLRRGLANRLESEIAELDFKNY